LEQIADLVAPLNADIDAVTQWLNTNGVTDVKLFLSRDFIKAQMTTAQASKLFNIDYHTYKHVSGKTVDISVGPYSVPTSISNKLDFVSGIVGFPDIDTPRTHISQPQPDIGTDITPEVIRARYNVSSTTVSTNSKNSHAVAEFQAQYYSPTDLSKFWTTYVPFAPVQTVDQVIGFNDPSSPGIEASLDIEYIMGVAPGCTTWFYSMKSFNFWQDLTTWVGELNNETNVPWVHSVSYGSQGDYPSESYRIRLNTEFQKVGTRGVSILFASGDDGAGCQGVGMQSPSACDCTFYPSFPATCPYITSVGATAFISGNTGADLLSPSSNLEVDSLKCSPFQATKLLLLPNTSKKLPSPKLVPSIQLEELLLMLVPLVMNTSKLSTVEEPFLLVELLLLLQLSLESLPF
jgi:tripeptidyl-peptidase-1